MSVRGPQRPQPLSAFVSVMRRRTAAYDHFARQRLTRNRNLSAPEMSAVSCAMWLTVAHATLPAPFPTRNSTLARSASKSSTGRSCRRCSGRGKIRGRRNNTARHHTSSSAHNLARRGSIPPDHRPARCCWAADDSRAGSRSRASDRRAAGAPARPTPAPARATRQLRLMRRMFATQPQHTRSAFQMRRLAGNFAVRPTALKSGRPNNNRAAARPRTIVWPSCRFTFPLDQRITWRLYVNQ